MFIYYSRIFKVHPEGKYVVDVDKGIDVNSINTGCRVALRADSYALHKILPNKVREFLNLNQEYWAGITFCVLDISYFQLRQS